MSNIIRGTILKIAVLIVPILLLIGCGYPNVVNSREDVEGSTIGGLAGTPSIRLATELGTARSYYSAEQMMIDLKAAQIDCVIMESTTAAELVSRTSGVRILLEPLVEYELRIAVPKENTRLLRAVDSALETLERNGTLRGLYNKYFVGRNYTYSMINDPETLTNSLTVALPPDSPPLSFKNDEGRFVGMDVEVIMAVGDILGVKIGVLEYDAWELATAVWHGRADLALGWHPSEGEGIVNMSEPYARVVQVVIVRR
ncbi:MAG: transporter substrate-binding domain-containing protein [Oscillospiraceae bacterium]|nr:transporter substrate-binding domain-containing protein [Oscillospiraceae bacterium]